MDEDIVAMLLTALVVFVPVAGLTLRFALKPMVDSIARLLEVRQGATTQAQGIELMEKRIALLEQELRLMQGAVSELNERREFYEKLSSPGR
jgi:hypothetical protein